MEAIKTLYGYFTYRQEPFLLPNTNKPYWRVVQDGKFTGDGMTARVHTIKVSHHNMAGRHGRHDFWFVVDDTMYHGVTIGDTQFARVTATKTPLSQAEKYRAYRNQE